MAVDRAGEPAAVPRPIEDYALIGNMLTAALVSRDGSIDWLCLPRFDSAACFSALLGRPENGRWKIAPADGTARVSRRYLPDTAALETRFESSGGVVTLTDFMPLSTDPDQVDVVRLISGVSGRVEMNMELVLRFGYGRTVPWVQRRDYGISAIAGPDTVELTTRLPLRGENMKTVSNFTVAEGESVPITLSYHPTLKRPHFVSDARVALEQTCAWWREWVSRSSFEDMPEAWREPVVRSLVTLKLLTFAPSGGIVAAPTTSLPERIGGTRNWDYRYCWIRDSALTLYALLNAGYREEAEAWRQWVLRAVAGEPRQLQILYGVAGERWLPEHEIPWLDGYAGSRPVRIGNGAAAQAQLDVYGELLDTLHAARESALQSRSDAWQLQKVLVEHLEEHWQTLDHGIWEIRGAPRAYTHSRVMCWVALDRAVISVERFGLDGPVDRWRTVRAAIHDDICRNGFNEEINSFVQYYGGRHLDASLLLMPQVGFLPPDDPRMIGTIAAIERDLMQDGLVRRYATEDVDDGVGGAEGAFLVCTFWLVDAYVLSGRFDDARALFDRLLALRNDVGLLAEEYDARSGRQLGNFPQAYSHIGLINAAHNLMSSSGPARQRAEHVAPRRSEKVSGGAERTVTAQDAAPS